MVKYIGHDMCIQSNVQVCIWPKYHTALKSLADHGQIFGVDVIDDYPSRGGLVVNTTRSITSFLDKSSMTKCDVKEKVKSQILLLLKYLKSGL